MKAFKTFSPDYTPTSEEVGQEEEDYLVEEEATFENICDDLIFEPGSTDDFTQVEYEMPPHERCASHMLNLVASSDIDKSLSSSPLSKPSTETPFTKCSALWNKASRSTVASDHVEVTLKTKLTVPTPTCWNSYYDAVSRITENTSNELNALCAKLELRCFNKKEWTF